jgi:hypothetical protein
LKNAEFDADSGSDEKVAKNHAKKYQRKSVMEKYGFRLLLLGAKF